MKRTILLLSAFFTVVLTVGVFANSAPVVSNVTAAQRQDASKLVDIYYDLNDVDGDGCTVWVLISDTNGVSWRVPAISCTGDVGPGVTLGSGKHIIWDAGADVPGKVGNLKARVYADDGKGPSPMVLVPAGPFLYQNSTYVAVDSFFIDKYEITNQFYCQFLNNADPTGAYWLNTNEIVRWGEPGKYSYSIVPGRENYPVRYVNYFDAMAFAAWRSNLEGAKYRLPTEEEWEKAAAWDPVENHYYIYGCHSDTIDCTWCNYKNCVGGTTPVGYYNGTGGRHDAKSYYGCYDMSGNVWELVLSQYVRGQDVYTGYWVGDEASRGGCWEADAASCQSSVRNITVIGYFAGQRFEFLGFRLVRDLKE